MSVKECKDCPNEQLNYPKVFGNGNKLSEIVLIGEGPRKNEVAQGVPFSDKGRSGSLLWGVLKKIGFTRDSFYTTNAVKCSIENPTKEMVVCCSKFLKKELEECLNKKLVVAIGDKIFKFLVPQERKGILASSGKIYDSDFAKCKTLACIHPARVLRREREYNLLESTLKKLTVGSSDSIVLPTDIQEVILESQIDLLEEFRGQKIVLDIETNASLDYVSPASKIEAIGLTDGKKVFIVSHQALYSEKLLSLLGTMDLIGHNLSFDVKFIKAKLGEWLSITDDTMIMGFLLGGSLGDTKGGNSLETLAVLHLGVAPWKSLAKEVGYMTKEYIVKDVFYTWKLYELFESLVPRVYREFFIPALNMKTKVEYHGINFDIALCKRISRSLTYKTEHLKKELKEITLYPNYNPNSSKQNLCVFTEVLGTKVSETNEKFVMKHINNPFFKKLLEYRKMIKLNSTFCSPDTVRSDSKVHTTFNVHGTLTGRISSSSPNIQNIPAKIRRLYLPDKGHLWWVKVDYNQLEMRVAIALAGLTELMDMMNKGHDFHTVTAMLITGKPASGISKKERRRAKDTNFGCLYGAGIELLAAPDKLDCSLTEAQAFKERYFGKFEEWKRKKEEEVLVNHYVETVFGHRRWFPLITRENINEVKREAVNMIVQGTAGQMCLSRIVEVEPILPEKFGAYVVNMVHDEVDISSPGGGIERQVGDYVKGIFEKKFSFTDLQFSASVEIKKRWF